MSDKRQDLFRYVAEEFAEDYREGEIDRREFLRRSILLSGGVAGARTLLASLGVLGVSAAELARAQVAAPRGEAVKNSYQVAPDDPAVTAQNLEYTARGFRHFAYLARPSTMESAPGVLVIHENRGLQPHVRDVARRLAKAGYIALAPDLVSKAGGTPRYTDTAQISAYLAQAGGDEHVTNLLEALRVLRSTPGVRADRIGVVGFCFGGGLTWRLATEVPDLRAAAPFYGPAPDLERVRNIGARVLGIYGGNDARINAGIPALEAALKAASRRYEIRVYEGAGHAFHNDTGANYRREAAEDAWKRVLELFAAELKS
ncbi:carboxymethylenebutenolidase [Deinobacterium chartae]|uniref:Carboxymethylenebutenolidase n=1 Tax=Deinobacterium chartae TaxID=521158 RepID=A0A841I2Z5_9DEIO|nr:dienelactone hydrolase family protein [Deinobacterium chartae]MBB6099394.1 carboxymethylenebutenolidase [Deinobacterium chartae]